MSTNLPVEETMEKKIYAPKGALTPIDGPRLRQDGSSVGSSQVPSVQFSKSKSQSRRRDYHGASNVVNFRPGPSGAQKKFPSKGRGGKGRQAEKESEQEVVPSDNDSKQNVAEFGSLQLPGSKKQNLSHLLNFHFTPREPPNRGSGFLHHPPRVVRSKFFNDSFIQANCQFMVASDENIEYHDVDILVNWKSVEQIIIRTYGGTPGCPICLTAPCAAKITKCGHIFCYACILRYLSYSDGNSHPCPICFKPITSDELRSVVAIVLHDFHSGDTVNMQLMCRRKDSTSGCMPVAAKLGNVVEDWEKRYKKLLPVDPAQVQSEILNREHLELSAQIGETVESLETEFVNAAMTALGDRTKLLQDKMNASEIMKHEVHDHDKSKVEPDISKMTSCDEGAVGETLLDQASSGVRVNWDEYSCFYQAADGSNVFMSPLNMAMAWKNFGQDPSAWPQTLALRVLEIESLTVTAELRKRMKFLQHISLNSSVQLVEFDLKEVVTKEIMAEFSYQISERKRRRSERQRIEKRRERMHEEAERRANMQPRKPKIESLSDFPECGSPEENANALKHAIEASLVCSGGVDKLNEPQENPIPISTKRSMTTDFPPFPQLSTSPSLSFAQALNTPGVWKRSPTFPITTKATATALPPSRQRGVSETEIDVDNMAVPEYRNSVSDAIASAFAKFTLKGQGEAGSESSTTNGQKKKGRKKGKVLFATAMGGMGNN